MNKHIVEAYVFQGDIKQTVYYTQGTDALPILFLFRDYDIPAGSSVGVFVEKPSKKGVQSTAATLDAAENSVLVEMDKQMTAEVGTAYMQLRLTKDGKELFTFEQPICVERSATPIISENGMPFIDESLAKMKEAAEDTKAATADAREVTADMLQKAENGEFSASIKIGEVTTGGPGSVAAVRNSGTEKDVILNFDIPTGPQGPSGIMAATSGMFSVYLDLATGELYAEYPEDGAPPPIIYDANTGNLYYITG